MDKNNQWLYLAITGSSIKMLRREAGLTQKRLAELVGVSQAHIAKIEQGKVDPRLSTINKILQVLTGRKQRKCADIMTEGVLFARPDDDVSRASQVMVESAVSQLPVIDGNRVVGTITEESIIRNLRVDIANEKVKRIMGPPLPSVAEDTDISVIRLSLKRHQGVLVTRNKELAGIITRSDLLKTIG